MIRAVLEWFRCQLFQKLSSNKGYIFSNEPKRCLEKSKQCDASSNFSRIQTTCHRHRFEQTYTVDVPTETKHPVSTLSASSEADRESLMYFLVPIYPKDVMYYHVFKLVSSTEPTHFKGIIGQSRLEVTSKDHLVQPFVRKRSLEDTRYYLSAY